MCLVTKGLAIKRLASITFYTSTVVYDDPESGVIIQHNPRGLPTTELKLNADEQ
jgi:hypothetical protein